LLKIPFQPFPSASMKHGRCRQHKEKV